MLLQLFLLTFSFFPFLLFPELNDNLAGIFKTVLAANTSNIAIGTNDHKHVNLSYTTPEGYTPLGVIEFDGTSWGAAFGKVAVGSVIVTNTASSTVTLTAGQITEKILCVRSDFL